MIRVFTGRTDDPDELKGRLDRQQEVLAGTPAWASTTAGVTDEGRSIAVVRFEAVGSAGDHADRDPSATVTVEDYPGVDVYLGGESGTAGFVQVFTGTAADIDRFRAIGEEMAPRFAVHRPEETGDVVGWRPDGRFVFAGYYTSEEEARAGEKTDVPADLQARWDEWHGLCRDLVYFDLRRPWVWARR